MDIKARIIADAGKHNCGCAVVPLHSHKRLSAAATQLDRASRGLVRAALKNGDLGTERGATLLLQTGLERGPRRILLVSVGNPAKLDNNGGRQLADTIVRALRQCQSKDACLYLQELPAGSLELSVFCHQLALSATTAGYRYCTTVSKPKVGLTLNKLTVNCGRALTIRSANVALTRGRHVGDGINVARQLGNLPGNICTPSYLAREARKLARAHGKLTSRILDEKQMRALGMGALLSVSAGSAQAAKLIVMHYRGGKAGQQPQVLVGKGITFDSGGISLKPGAKMDEMKFDMCGAASVFGTLHAILAMQLPLNVVGIIAASENLPGSAATKPGDVVTGMSGKTIEILNTDAEGRLVLSDALSYAERFKPAAVIDIATLTGACVVALGAHASGLFANDDKLAGQLDAAGQSSFDRVWRMPLWDDYQKQIDTPFADVANIGSHGAGSITAACFLARFTGNYAWAHLDIAGSGYSSAPKGATGRPVGLADPLPDGSRGRRIGHADR